jgi:hypothetical protein
MAWMLAVRDPLHWPQIDVQAFLFEKALVVSHPHGRQIHRQRRAEHDDFLI